MAALGTKVLHLFRATRMLALLVHGERLEQLVKLHLIVLEELLEQTCLIEDKSPSDSVVLREHEVFQSLHVLNLA